MMNGRQEQYLLKVYKEVGDTLNVFDYREIGKRKRVAMSEAQSIDTFRSLQELKYVSGSTNFKGILLPDGRNAVYDILERRKHRIRNGLKALSKLMGVGIVATSLGWGLPRLYDYTAKYFQREPATAKPTTTTSAAQKP